MQIKTEDKKTTDKTISVVKHPLHRNVRAGEKMNSTGQWSQIVWSTGHIKAQTRVIIHTTSSVLLAQCGTREPFKAHTCVYATTPKVVVRYTTNYTMLCAGWIAHHYAMRFGKHERGTPSLYVECKYASIQS